ncbi:uncharacterized protein (DUF305 family) [Janthinobacterium sp. CG_23.3]|uniref:DUF305 domain-containing protein n=1 Tax=Janthinobacterium sp. CG_23.3 TaxID=3349634 RepID=UPI0038D39651
MYSTNNNANALRGARELISVLAIATAAYALPFSAAAQAPPAGTAKMQMGASASADAPMKMPKSMDNMHKKMAAMQMTGDPDIDFAMMMVAHHEGAIGMAQAEIDAGKDPAMIKAAKKIITAQKKEIAQFHDWLKKHPHPMK